MSVIRSFNRAFALSLKNDKMSKRKLTAAFRKVCEIFVKTTKMDRLHLANREINTTNQQQNFLCSKNKLTSDLLLLVLISTFIAFLKPFGMHDIPFLYSLGYWFVGCIVGYAVYAPTIHVGEKWITNYFSKTPYIEPISIAVSAVVASVFLSFIVPLINYLFFGYQGDYLALVPQMLLYCLVIGGFITFISVIKTQLKQQQVALAEHSTALNIEQKKAQTANSEHLSKLLNKIPLEKRGKLLCFEMDDHYVNIHTDKGSHLVLMRFKDALSHVANYPGVQTHRSWWVALDAVKSEVRDGRKNLLKLSNGILAPISKTYAERVKHRLSERDIARL